MTPTIRGRCVPLRTLGLAGKEEGRTGGQQVLSLARLGDRAQFQKHGQRLWSVIQLPGHRFQRDESKFLIKSDRAGLCIDNDAETSEIVGHPVRKRKYRSQ